MRNHDQYVEEARAIRHELSRFINSEPSESGVDYNHVYDMLDRVLTSRLVEDIQFAVFKKDFAALSVATSNLLEQI